MIMIPPRHYVIISDPIVRGEDGEPVTDKHGQIKLRHSDHEIRLFEDWQDPFPLYPGESQQGNVEQLQIVEENSALRLKAVRDLANADGEERSAGDEWLFQGPATYVPRVEEEVVEVVEATVIAFNEALKLRARRACVDNTGTERKAGEEWLVCKPGAYLPRVDEEVVETVEAIVLTDKQALHLQAVKTFTDVYGKVRKAGEGWLVTCTESTTHVVDVYEEVVGDGLVELITLTNRQYCVVVDPVVDGVQKLGTEELRRGECSFFLQPGESLEDGIREMHVLADDEALLLQAKEAFTDKQTQKQDVEKGKEGDGEEGDGAVFRRPGDCWMVYGPCEYVPPVTVEIKEKRRSLPLDDNEGVYVRDTRTGQVRAVIGATYMLQPQEELWRKTLPPEVEELLSSQEGGVSAYVGTSGNSRSVERGTADRRKAGGGTSGLAGTPAPAPSTVLSASGRDESKVVSFRVPHNAAMQVYDYKSKVSRIVFGPSMVMLGCDEQFSVIRLSGDKPKRPNVISTLCLQLGPDFMTDVVTVETSDHARLNLTLSFNWQFDVDRSSQEAAAKIFNVRDFVGDACKALASRVRGAVAAETFDNFHKHSAQIIRNSIFGMDLSGKIKGKFVFAANNLCITNVDIQSVEPVDARTRESLQKSVQLAIEITTNSLEARAKHKAKKEEEEAKGRLERQQIENQSHSETARRELLELQSKSSAIEAQGAAVADAKARAESATIAGEAAVRQAQLRAQAMKVESEAKLESLQMQQKAALEHQREVDALEIQRQRDLQAIEAKKFDEIVTAIGPDTIAKIAQAGPEMQAKLLGGLGLQGFLVTDGKNPINLFQTANGLVGGGGGGGMVMPGMPGQ
jgi:major vault protein